MAACDPEIKTEIKNENKEFTSDELKKESETIVKNENGIIIQNGQHLHETEGIKRIQSDIKRQIENNENDQPSLKKPKHENIDTNVSVHYIWLYEFNELQLDFRYNTRQKIFLKFLNQMVPR